MSDGWGQLRSPSGWRSAVVSLNWFVRMIRR